MDSAARGIVTLTEATIQAIAQAVMVELWKQDMASLLADLRKGSNGIAQALRAAGEGIGQAAECPNCGGDKYRGAHVHPDCFNYGVPLTYVCRPQPAPPEPAKVECPNCRQRVDYADQHYHREDMPHVAAYYVCDKPAPPESAPQCRARKGQPCAYSLAGWCIYCREFKPDPAAVRNAAKRLRRLAVAYRESLDEHEHRNMLDKKADDAEGKR